jgi:probable rRNA maturation factor
MLTLVDNRSGQSLPLNDLEELAAFVLGRELGTEAISTDRLELALSFVDEEEMAALNAAWRGKEGPTDILSFEMDNPWEKSAPSAPSLTVPHTHAAAPASARFAPSPADEPLLLGDVVIQPNIARERAEAQGLPFEQGLWLLIIHGILHLLGYDHQTLAQAELMEAREDEYMLAWGQRHASSEGQGHVSSEGQHYASSEGQGHVSSEGQGHGDD